MIVFDIETAPLPLEQVKQTLPPFDPSTIGSHPGQFDPDSVKLGNTKDPKKVEEKIEQARQKHADAVAAYEKKQETAEEDHWNAVLDKAALSAVTGQVVAIGYLGKKKQLHLAIDGVIERALLTTFWKTYRSARASSRPLVGFNIKGFDVPFVAQRSWILGIDVPASMLTPAGYLDSTFVDLFDRWRCGNRFGGQNGHAKLDTVCKSCGLPTKPDGIDGDDFARLLWSDDQDERDAAAEYLSNDLAMTAALADRLGVS